MNRKVCSIFSKIINGVLNREPTWQDYLKRRLLTESGCEKIVFSETKLIETNKNTIHIVAGKGNFESFKFQNVFTVLGELEKI